MYMLRGTTFFLTYLAFAAVYFDNCGGLVLNLDSGYETCTTTYRQGTAADCSKLFILSGFRWVWTLHFGAVWLYRAARKIQGKVS